MPLSISSAQLINVSILMWFKEVLKRKIESPHVKLWSYWIKYFKFWIINTNTIHLSILTFPFSSSCSGWNSRLPAHWCIMWIRYCNLIGRNGYSGWMQAMPVHKFISFVERRLWFLHCSIFMETVCCPVQRILHSYKNWNITTHFAVPDTQIIDNLFNRAIGYNFSHFSYSCCSCLDILYLSGFWVF